MKSIAVQGASFLWSVASALARASSRGVDARVRVISVGNIQAGGAGKTPLVAEIARQGATRGLTVCILLRGYGGEWERTGGVIAPNSREAAPSTTVCGDEASLLHDLAPQAWIGVGACRTVSLERVRKLAPRIDLVLLDDGFQNHQLKKDLEIVALTSAGRGERFFRDFDSALTRAGLVVLTKGGSAPEGLSAPVAKVQFAISKASQSMPVFLFTAVADAEFVAHSMKDAGYTIVHHERFSDHARLDRATVESIRAKAQGLKIGPKIAMTGKDWVKWREISPDRDVLVIEPELVLDLESKRVWNQVLWSE